MTPFRRIGSLALLVGVLATPAAAQQGPATLSVEQIQPGQKGYGLTVFSGFKIERFSVEVVDVLKNFLPKQDVILIRCDHPRLRITGIQGGMSGSPIYINGKLIGALAYGWRFSKEPIAGVTPIKDMLELVKWKTRGPSSPALVQARPRPGESRALAELTKQEGWWRTPVFSRQTYPEGGLAPVSVPLAAAGFSTEALADLKAALGPLGFEPMQGGGTGRAEGPDKLAPGSAVGVQLVSGDLSLTGTGTVTWVGGNKVLAFGHNMFNAGEIYLPAVTAKINHTVASLSRSFKLASPARPVGTLVHDRQPGIMVDTGRRLPTVPMKVTLRDEASTRVFNAQLASHRLLTPSLAVSVVNSALTQAMSEVSHSTFQVTTTLVIKGQAPVKIVEHRYASAGVRRMGIFFVDGLRALSMIQNNDFGPVEFERIEVDINVRYGAHVVDITELSLSSTTVEPGSRVNVTVKFRPYGGHEFTQTYPLEIHPSLAGSVLQLEVAGGGLVYPERAPAQNLKQYLKQLQESYPAQAVVLSLYTPAQGLKLGGQVLRDLPQSVMDALHTASRIRSEQTYQPVQRQIFGTARLVGGRQRIRIRVKSEVEK
ncbi:MAG: hypothetical protein IT371_08150 [Deltaproteobacteria bacterium]|nr:hypothetical protein [Deltaproteobacteria bacterium]